MEASIVHVIVLSYTVLNFGASLQFHIPKKNKVFEIRNRSTRAPFSNNVNTLFAKAKDLPLVTLDNNDVISFHVTSGQQSSPLYVLTQSFRNKIFKRRASRIKRDGNLMNLKKNKMDKSYTNESPILHVRHKRATNDTSSSSSGFLDEPYNVAMYIVLPIIVLIYGGCMVIYCCYKCQDYVERTQPLQTLKRKIFRLPEQNSDDMGAPGNAFLLQPDRGRPTSSRSMPPEENTRNSDNFDDLRSIASAPGLHYNVGIPVSGQGRTKTATDSDLSLQVASPEDLDSGVHSDETSASRVADERIVYIDGPNKEIRNMLSNNSVSVEVKHVVTAEIGVQTDECCPYHTAKDSTVRKSTYRPPPKKVKNVGNVASRYLDWLKHSRELQDVINNRLNPSPPKLSERHPIKPIGAAGGTRAGTFKNRNMSPETQSKPRIKSAYNSVVPVEKTPDSAKSHSDAEPKKNKVSLNHVSIKRRLPPSSYVSLYKQQKSNSTQKLLSDSKDSHRSVTSSSASDNSMTNDSTYSVTSQKVFYISGSPDVEIT